ncbi:hypothetical protein BZL39_K05280 [Zygosaccharomyces parabailii]|nr:hypothetical protein BZL39_K05280 [Zygosaccharomyces parabailii]
MSASVGYQFYKYKPNQGAAISFAVLFGLLTAAAAHIIMKLAKKSKWNSIELRNTILPSNHTKIRYYNHSKLTGAYAPYWVGCILEIGGYAARSFSSKNPQELIPYIIQSILLLIAPAFYAATVYMLFGRIANLLYADKLLMFPAKYNTLIFVLGDVFSLLLQAAGGGLMARGSSTNSGTHIIIGA